jgi:hypothetical protein
MSVIPPAATEFLQGMMGSVGGAVKKAVAAVTSGSDEQPRELTDGEKFYKEGLEDQKAFHPIWYRNVAMYLGHQWLDWNSSSNWLQESAAPSWRVKMVENVVLPLVRAAIAAELDSNPRFHGMPSTSEPQAKSAAKIAGRILEGKYYDEDFVNLFKRLRLWARMTGSAYMFALWNPRADKVWTDNALDAQGQPILGEDGQPQQKEYATGDVEYSVDNSFEVILQRGAPEDFKQHRRIMRVKIMDVKDIKDNWGVDVKPETLTLDTMYQARIMSLVDSSGKTRSQNSEGTILKDSALVKHYFELPSKEFPNGREFVFSNGVVLEKTHDLDYFYCGKRALPCGKTDDIEAPGRCQGDSGINHIAPVQIQINKMSSMIIENGNQMARPKVLAPVGCLDDDVFTDQPSEIVEYVPGPNGQKPEPYTPPEMPQYFLNKVAELRSIAQDIYGVHDVSLGRLPRRATSGRAIDSLQSADDSPLGLSMRSCGSALSRVLSISLDQMQRKYTENRIVRMIGKNHEVDVIQFKGADLKGCDFVRVVFGPHMTRGQKIDLALRLAEMPVAPGGKPRISNAQLLEVLELGSLDSIFDEDSFQTNYIEHENMDLMKGVVVPVGPLDDDEMHIKKHLDFAQGPAARATPDVLENIKGHIDLHKQQQMMKMAPAPNAPALPAPVPMPPQGAPA